MLFYVLNYCFCLLLVMCFFCIMCPCQSLLKSYLTVVLYALHTVGHSIRSSNVFFYAPQRYDEMLRSPHQRILRPRTSLGWTCDPTAPLQPNRSSVLGMSYLQIPYRDRCHTCKFHTEVEQDQRSRVVSCPVLLRLRHVKSFCLPSVWFHLKHVDKRKCMWGKAPDKHCNMLWWMFCGWWPKNS